MVAHWDPRHAFLLPREPGQDDRTTAAGRRAGRGVVVTALAPRSRSAGPRPAGSPPPARPGRHRLLPYLLLLPGAAWLLVFFAVPLLQLAAASLYDPTGSLSTGYALTWAFGNYPDALQAYWPQFARSFGYAGIGRWCWRC